jgi:hypothetical protein
MPSLIENQYALIAGIRLTSEADNINSINIYISFTASVSILTNIP